MGNKYVLLLVLLCSFKLYAQDSRFKVIGTVDTKYNDSLITLFTFTGDIVRTVDSTYVKMVVLVLKVGNIYMKSPLFL